MLGVWRKRETAERRPKSKHSCGILVDRVAAMPPGMPPGLDHWRALLTSPGERLQVCARPSSCCNRSAPVRGSLKPLPLGFRHVASGYARSVRRWEAPEIRTPHPQNLRTQKFDQGIGPKGRRRRLLTPPPQLPRVSPGAAASGVPAAPRAAASASCAPPRRAPRGTSPRSPRASSPGRAAAPPAPRRVPPCGAI